MVRVEITGYKRIEKEGRTLYYLSALALDGVRGIEGRCTFNAFVSSDHLRKHSVEEYELIGTLADYYSVKEGAVYKSGITFKNAAHEI